MRKLIFLVLALAAVGGAAYLFMFKRSDTTRLAKGYKDAETPQVAVDMFKRAIEKRDYDVAAHYCTAGSAEQYKRGAAAGTELGEAIDNLQYQLQERGLVRDELKIVLYALDPFPKDVQITVGKESGDNAEATFVFSVPYVGNQPASGSWSLKPEIFHVYARGMKFTTVTTAVVPMKKDKKEWKFDFPVDPAFQLRVGTLNDKYKNYVNPMQTVTQEVKNDPSTKDNVTTRLKTLLEQAAKE